MLNSNRPPSSTSTRNHYANRVIDPTIRHILPRPLRRHFHHTPLPPRPSFLPEGGPSDLLVLLPGDSLAALATGPESHVRMTRVERKGSLAAVGTSRTSQQGPVGPVPSQLRSFGPCGGTHTPSIDLSLPPPIPYHHPFLPYRFQCPSLQPPLLAIGPPSRPPPPLLSSRFRPSAISLPLTAALFLQQKQNPPFSSSLHFPILTTQPHHSWTSRGPSPCAPALPHHTPSSRL